MAARQFWRANGKRARRSSGVIQTRSTRRHEAVNISGAARERRNKSVKRDKEVKGGWECVERTRREGLGREETPRYDEAREGSRCESIRGTPLRAPFASLPLPPPSFPLSLSLNALILILLLLLLLQERFISRRDTTERQVTTSNCRISGCHLSRSNGFRSSRRSNATAARGR